MLLLQIALISCDNSAADKDKDKDNDKEIVKDKDKDKDNDDDNNGKKDNDKPNDDKPNDNDDNDKMSGNQGDPVAVVNMLISAAKSGNYAGLSNLCLPSDDGDTDGDVDQVCNIANESSEYKEEFRQFFGSAKVRGKAEINGNRAAVNISLQEDGEERDETIDLAKSNGKWYLAGF